MGELTEVALISTFGMFISVLLFTQLNLRSWFKKQQWTLHFTNIKKKNELQLKKMAKDLDVNYTGSQRRNAEPASGGGLAERFLPTIIKNLSPEQTAALAEKFIDGSDEEESGDIGDTLLKYAMQNPEMVNKFLGSDKNTDEIIDFEG